MSESDSFISEVTEEVRRDRLYRTLRRYGWLIASIVALIVGAAAWHEWSGARAQARAEARGDALRAALETTDPAARVDALAALTDGPSAVTARLAAAGAHLEAGRAVEAAAILDAVAADASTSGHYRALAALQRVMALGADLEPSERRAVLDTLAAEGAPFRLLALEQRALMRLELGETDAAVADLLTIAETPGAPSGVRGRAEQLIVALGGAPAEAAPPAVASEG